LFTGSDTLFTGSDTLFTGSDTLFTGSDTFPGSARRKYIIFYRLDITKIQLIFKVIMIFTMFV